ncbi:Spy/CpxP family protein refolding chaperone [Laspinema olomoucense]|uniref:Spy/CpxP family protein refolding chaperone n=1 Tax=Laspinema olomoucense D3b TaxID=2953688 RepID=A0ABT2N5X7_9CYAN|nr:MULTISPECIES: Spy/CpxP family protein refolding chaperone [unclassified Laspinema]MCT7978097.1 Spy/CpxP family protein refolding chaperone [Laspinema sp. D3b]MCT7988868.1 Spy/CpxP family protein refolding chaperone [Laspinema sp. D3a]MCT7993683.1 Spy/CpxP family protein refolding chaperone [Laspinema sp. D3c]
MSAYRLSLLAALMLTLGITTPAYAAPQSFGEQTIAQRPGGNHRDRGSEGGDQWAGKEGWLDQLNLTAQQQQDIQAIRDRYETQMQASREQMRQSMERMGQMMSDNTSDNDLRNQHNEILQMRQQIGQMQFEQMLAIRNVLTAEQRVQFAQLMQERRQNHQNRQGNQNRQNNNGNGRGNRPGSNRIGPGQ